MADTTRRDPIDCPDKTRPDALRVRMTFGTQRHARSGLTRADAEALVDSWRALRRAGLTPDTAPDDTLGHYAAVLLAHKRSPAAALRARGVEHWERSLRPWLPGAAGATATLAALPISTLRRARIEDWYFTRAVRPVIARNELDALKATLRLARDRGAAIDPGILTLERIRHERRELEPLAIHELEQIAAHAPAYARRSILLAGTTGLRWAELTGLEDREVDLDAGTITLAATRTKEGRRKIVDLTPEELTLLREQLAPAIHAIDPGSPTGTIPSRPAGTRLVFPTKTGRPWRHWQWLRFVWYPARARAAAAYRLELELEPDAPTPYDDRRPHDLRATAIALMLDAGMTPGAVATRVGHADGGAMIAARYDRDLERRRMRAQRELVARAGLGLRAAGAAALELEAAPG